MISGLYPFEQIIQDVSQETSITNLRNRYSEVRQLIARAEREINPYAGFLIKKKMIHYVGNGVFDGRAIKKPKDFVELDKVGCCQDGLCDGAYRENVSHIIICDGKERTEITWTYWALQFDGNGNPVTTYNHAEAVVAYIIWKMYSAKVFLGEGSSSLRREYKQEFEDRCQESRGEDMFPNEAQMDKIFQMNKWASLHFENMTTYDRCISCETCIETIEEPMTPIIGTNIYYWQLTNVQDNITQVLPTITEPFFDTVESQEVVIFQQGYIVSYTAIGRIAFAIRETELEQYSISDALNNDVTDEFDTQYLPDLKTLLFVSKNPYSHSSIYFKFKRN